MTESDIHVLDLLRRGADTNCQVQFITPRGTRETSFAELWSSSARAARAIANLPPGPLAGYLTPSAEMVACFIGCLRAGRDFVSLPLPARAQSPEGYASQIASILALANTTRVVAEEALSSLVHSVTTGPTRTLAVAEALCGIDDSTEPFSEPGSGALVQFSSGTTGVPKGVRLTATAIGASVAATLDALAVGGTAETFCSWLPLSHDMGLIGGLLGSWAGCGRTRPGYKYICISPELFAARPLIWLETCSKYEATVTSGPTFAYDLLSRHLDRCQGELKLSPLRTAIIGAEPVTERALNAFVRSAARHGFRDTSLAPAYGLAEATLAVSMRSPGTGWTSRSVSVDGRAGSYVSCGRVLSCVSLDAPDVSQGARPLRIRGPAVCSATLPPRPFDGEWLRTGDIGALADGELFIAGRTDDLMSFAGRNVFAWELELEAVSSGAVRMGDCAVVRDGEGGYAVFFELRAVGANMHDDAAFHAIRRQLASTMGIGPSFIGALPRGVLPKTSSGKIKRKSLEAMRDAYTEACIECRRF